MALQNYWHKIHTLKFFLTAKKMSSIKHIDRCSKLFNSWDSLLNKSNTPSKSISEWKRDTKFLLSLISVILRSPSDNIAMHLSSWILYLSSTSFQSLKQNKITKLKKQTNRRLFKLSTFVLILIEEIYSYLFVTSQSWISCSLNIA